MEPGFLKPGNDAAIDCHAHVVVTSMEPGFLKPGNYCRGTPLPQLPWNFNGAGLPEARKPRGIISALAAASPASMEPGFLKPGNERKQQIMLPHPRATSMEPGFLKPGNDVRHGVARNANL